MPKILCLLCVKGFFVSMKFVSSTFSLLMLQFQRRLKKKGWVGVGRGVSPH